MRCGCLQGGTELTALIVLQNSVNPKLYLFSALSYCADYSACFISIHLFFTAQLALQTHPWEEIIKHKHILKAHSPVKQCLIL